MLDLLVKQKLLRLEIDWGNVVRLTTRHQCNIDDATAYRLFKHALPTRSLKCCNDQIFEANMEDTHRPVTMTYHSPARPALSLYRRVEEGFDAVCR